jgi:hypothetical protein
MKRPLKLWVGLAELDQKCGEIPLGSPNKAACVNVIGLAFSPSDFSRRAERALSEADFNMVSLEDVEAFTDRVNAHEVHARLRELAREAEEDGQVKFGTFHTYPVKPKPSRAKPDKKRNSRGTRRR